MAHDTHEPSSKLFAKPATTLILDHTDFLMGEKDSSYVEILELVRALIKESKESQNLNVLLVANSWERAKELVDAGCKLVPGDAPARWTRGQHESLFATLLDPAKETLSEKKDKLLGQAMLSGTPGYLTITACSDSQCPYDPCHATMHNLECSRGIKALYSPLLELAKWSQAVATKGRFPDKNGIFHHEDLVELWKLLLLATLSGTPG
jgi:hypothetical protein